MTPVGRSGSQNIPPEASHPGAAGPAQLFSGRRQPLGQDSPLWLWLYGPDQFTGFVSFCAKGQDAGNLGRTWWAQGTLLLWCVYMWVVGVTWQSPVCGPLPGMGGKGGRVLEGDQALAWGWAFQNKDNSASQPCGLDSMSF